MSRHIAFVVFPGFELLDLSGPLCAFEFASHLSGGAYRMTVVSEAGGPILNSCGFAVASEPFGGSTYDTLIVTGGLPDSMPGGSAKALELLQASSAKSLRTASVCTGAFLLAAAGLLDGKRATTHWRYASQLQAQYPAIRVDADKIFIQDGKVWTSAGITAGIDLALAFIEADLGMEISRSVARNLVVYHRRPGGQSQFSALLELEPPNGPVRQSLIFAREHLHKTYRGASGRGRASQSEAVCPRFSR